MIDYAIPRFWFPHELPRKRRLIDVDRGGAASRAENNVAIRREPGGTYAAVRVRPYPTNRAINVCDAVKNTRTNC